MSFEMCFINHHTTIFSCSLCQFNKYFVKNFQPTLLYKMIIKSFIRSIFIWSTFPLQFILDDINNAAEYLQAIYSWDTM